MDEGGFKNGIQGLDSLDLLESKELEKKLGKISDGKIAEVIGKIAGFEHGTKERNVAFEKLTDMLEKKIELADKLKRTEIADKTKKLLETVKRIIFERLQASSEGNDNSSKETAENKLKGELASLVVEIGAGPKKEKEEKKPKEKKPEKDKPKEKTESPKPAKNQTPVEAPKPKAEEAPIRSDAVSKTEQDKMNRERMVRELDVKEAIKNHLRNLRVLISDRNKNKYVDSILAQATEIFSERPDYFDALQDALIKEGYLKAVVPDNSQNHKIDTPKPKKDRIRITLPPRPPEAKPNKTGDAIRLPTPSVDSNGKTQIHQPKPTETPEANPVPENPNPSPETEPTPEPEPVLKKFLYETKNKDGKRATGVLEAVNMDNARAKIESWGQTIVSIQEALEAEETMEGMENETGGQNETKENTKETEKARLKQVIVEAKERIKANEIKRTAILQGLAGMKGGEMYKEIIRLEDHWDKLFSELKKTSKLRVFKRSKLVDQIDETRRQLEKIRREINEKARQTQQETKV